MVFQGEIGGSRARRKAIVFHKKISNDCLVLRIFRLRLNIIKVVFGKTARAALAVAKFLQIEDEMLLKLTDNPSQNSETRSVQFSHSVMSDSATP